MDIELLKNAYVSALDGMVRRGPRALHDRAAVELDDEGQPAQEANDKNLLALLQTAELDDYFRRAFHTQLGMWDYLPSDGGASWANDTKSNTNERRTLVLNKLQLSDDIHSAVNNLFPVVGDDTILIAEKPRPWYGPKIRDARDFYWSHYADYLLSRGKLSPQTITQLDAATTRVVERLTNPAQEEVYQSKGLVVGYVQSGKTANFTGVIAKAIDAGYRLIIVLSGTTDLLRSQTQRRVDMELVGSENILRGVDPKDEIALAEVDYRDDDDWKDGHFVSHGGRPADLGHPDIHRLTTHAFDYRSLKQGIAALDFERRDRTRRLYDPVNLYNCDARLLVVKKYSRILQHLVTDLGKITAKLEDIPALIIDDESDQASVNTSNPRKWKQGKTERSAINKHISKMLEMLPRGQYVGYTATPFANVFVDPGDALDIFPRDFLLSLDRPDGYMGSEDFHDFDSDGLEGSEPNKDAHVRVQDTDTDTDLLRAVDAFVLSGAIKLIREEQSSYSFRHHTMLVHEAPQTVKHRAMAERIKLAWKRSGYLTGSARDRLQNLFEDDFAPRLKFKPPTFEDVMQSVPKAARRIAPGNNPVLVVNSDKDLEQEAIDFDGRSVWRILVGGNKLARGFTVEGLTISYYRRKTDQADTLMQMGRWFGFRPGYRDLVRLYTTSSLYDAFGAICRDERDFRNELRQYTFMVDGEPVVTPAEIPPLVASRMLRPTAIAKMYNAFLTERRTLGKEPSSGYPRKGDRRLAANVRSILPLLKAASSSVALSVGDVTDYRGITFRSKCGSVSHSDVLSVLGKLKWSNEETFRADLAWLASLKDDQVDGWVVVLPQPKAGVRATFGGIGPFGLHGRGSSDEFIRGNSESVHRNAADVLARAEGNRTGYLLIYPAMDKQDLASLMSDQVDPENVVMAISVRLPQSAQPKDGRVLKFKTRDSSQPLYSIVNQSSTPNIKG